MVGIGSAVMAVYRRHDAATRASDFAAARKRSTMAAVVVGDDG